MLIVFWQGMEKRAKDSNKEEECRAIGPEVFFYSFIIPHLLRRTHKTQLRLEVSVRC